VVAVNRSVSGESGFINFLFYFLVSSCLLASLLAFVLLEKIILLGNSNFNYLLREKSCRAKLTLVIQLLRSLRNWLSGRSKMHV